MNQNIKGCDASNSSGPHYFVINSDTNNYSLYPKLTKQNFSLLRSSLRSKNIAMKSIKDYKCERVPPNCFKPP